MKTQVSRFLIFLLLITYGCSDGSKEKVKNTEASQYFKSFEISYSDGWEYGVTYLIDSNKIFLSQQSSGFLRYGIIPDSIYGLIKSTIAKMEKESTIQASETDCASCPRVAIEYILKSDTIRVSQANAISDLFLTLIRSLQNFNDIDKSSSVPPSWTFTTRYRIAPLPPPSIPPPLKSK